MFVTISQAISISPILKDNTILFYFIIVISILLITCEFLLEQIISVHCFFERIYNRISLGLFVLNIVYCSLSATVHAPMF
jgi:hypothetical protein